MRWLILLLLPSQVVAWDLYDGFWEGVYWEPGAHIKMSLYADSCGEHVPEIERQVTVSLRFLSYLDPSRTWEYIGHSESAAWGVWDDGIVGIECRPRNIMGGADGKAQPKLNSDNSAIVDGAIILNRDMFAHDLARVVLHEMGHALITMDHSKVPGATMQTKIFTTEFSSQFAEYWSHDDLCAVKAKYDHIGESIPWPVDRSVIDDKLNLYTPYAEWDGKTWELTMLNNGQAQFSVVLAKERADCSELKN